MFERAKNMTQHFLQNSFLKHRRYPHFVRAATGLAILNQMRKDNQNAK